MELFKTCLIFLLSASAVQGIFKRVCYYTGWASTRKPPDQLNPDQIDPYLCTHLMWAFASLADNGTHIVPAQPREAALYPHFTRLKSRNPALKTMLSIGGWEMGSTPFVQLVSSEANMQTFATNAIHFLRSYNFDGIDLDWEYPGTRGSSPQDKDNYVKLLKIMRNAFEQESNLGSKHRLILAAAVGVSPDRVIESYDIEGLSNYLDFVNLMMYDFHGEWEEVANVHSALYSDFDASVHQYVTYWVNAGAPKNKLVVGVPFYGRKFNLANVSSNEPGSSSSGGGDVPYYEICQLINRHQIKPEILTTERVPYFVHNGTWVGYDDMDSIREKANYVRAHGLAGVMVWAIDLDDIHGVCGNGPFPLMHALNYILVDPIG